MISHLSREISRRSARCYSTLVENLKGGVSENMEIVDQPNTGCAKY